MILTIRELVIAFAAVCAVYLACAVAGDVNASPSQGTPRQHQVMIVVAGIFALVAVHLARGN